MTVPLVVLSLLSIVGGFVNTPAGLGNFHGFTDLMRLALPPAVEGQDMQEPPPTEITVTASVVDPLGKTQTGQAVVPLAEPIYEVTVDQIR